jgi:uncharacterized protein YgbK (DUF1537 family)
MRAKSLSVAIVADDLTGALDTAAPFASHGLDTWLALCDKAVSRSAKGGAEVLAITTESRHLSPDESASRVADGFAVLHPLRPEIVFKKIDSLLRGNVGAEIVASLLATGRRHAIIAPSVPSQNRLMRDGTIYVNGLPLPTSGEGGEYVEMPKSPHLPDLMDGSVALSVHISPAGYWPTLASGPGLHAYVADAAVESDLDALAEFVIQRSLDVLLVGASGFGRALARGIGDGLPPRQPDISPGMLLYVIGSRGQASAEQIAALRAAGADDIAIPVGADDDVSEMMDRLINQRTASLLVVRPESIEFAGVPALEIAGRLARVASAIARRLRPSAIIMAGGDTAAACAAALEADCLQVSGELHDGIAFGTMLTDSGEMPFFTKSGSFGPRDTWIRLAELLRRRRA